MITYAAACWYALALVWFSLGVDLMRAQDQPLFFSSPQQAVNIVRELLEKEDYSMLTRYCNVESGLVTLDSLVTGAYFLRRHDEVPAWIGKHVRPFPPSFEYLSHERSGQHVKVITYLRIDQGDGTEQEVQHHFFLSQTEHGYRLLIR